MKVRFECDRQRADKPFLKIGRFHVPAGLVWRRVPAFMLLLALSTVFLFGSDYGHHYSSMSSLYWRNEHVDITLNHLSLAVNLAAEHNFLSFYRQTLTPDGNLSYEVYNRFPVGGHVLIKLVTLPFPNDLVAQVHAARLLMRTFFAGAAMLAYLSLSRLTSSRWAALGATLLSFSSPGSLFYSDMISTEGVVDLFGMMLVFHGIAVFSTPSVGERKRPVPLHTNAGFGQLLAKTCAALLLGWYVYALLLPFMMLGLAGVLARGWKGQVDWASVRRYLALGAVALVFGTTVLGINFTREYFALSGQVSLTDLPSVQAILRRTAIQVFVADGEVEEVWVYKEGSILGWTIPSLLRQFRRVYEASVPSVLTPLKSREVTYRQWLGVAVTLATIGSLCLRTTPHRLPLTALTLSSFCWMFFLYNGVNFHDYYGMFYIGIPLVFFASILFRLEHAMQMRWSATGSNRAA